MLDDPTCPKCGNQAFNIREWKPARRWPRREEHFACWCHHCKANWTEPCNDYQFDNDFIRPVEDDEVPLKLDPDIVEDFNRGGI